MSLFARVKRWTMLTVIAVLAAAGGVVWGANFADWSGSCLVTFKGYTGSESLEQFPVLLELSEARILGFNYGQLQANGADLRFSDMAGSELPYEIDTWDSSGTSYVWVRVAELVDSTTTIMMHWGNDAAEKPEYDGAESVWANGYVGVWHLGDAGNGRNNSTGAGYNGVADSSGVAATGAGLIGRADIFSGTTTGRANNAPTTGGITCGNLSITGSQSVEAWIKPTDMSQRRIVVAKAYGGEGSMVLETDGRVRFFQGSAGSDTTPHDTHSTPLEAIVNERWSHVMHVRDSTSEPAMLHWYINGELVNSQEQTLAIRGSTSPFMLAKATSTHLTVCWTRCVYQIHRVLPTGLLPATRWLQPMRSLSALYRLLPVIF